MADTETIDFTYVTVCEEDADEVDIILDGGGVGDDGDSDDDIDHNNNNGLSPEHQQPRENHPQGDVLTVLLSGAATAQTSDAIVVRAETMFAVLR